MQPDAPTVQGELERALGRVCGEPVRVVGAGRTDAGVHATGQVISFRGATGLDDVTLARAVNALLPDDIALSSLERVGDDFHARFSATSRAYEYRLRTGSERRPLERAREHWSPRPLDLDAMRAAARSLLGRRDFSAFAAGEGGARTIRRADWRREGSLLRFQIEADAFLRGMVRAIVGTLLWVGRGKMGVDEFARIVAAGDRSAAGPSAPAHGLCLVAVQYGGGDGRRRLEESELDE